MSGAALDPVPRHGRRARWLSWSSLAILLAVALAAGWWGYRAHQRRSALRLAEEGQFEEAVGLLERALTRSPDDVELLAALARGHVEAGNLDSSLRALDPWCRLRPDDPEPRRLRMESLRKMGRFEEALADGLRLMELEADGEALAMTVAGVAFSAGDFDQAEALCRRVLAREPGRREARRLLAESFRARRRPKEAADLLDGLLREQSDDTAALMGRGSLALEMGEPEKAIELLQKVVRLDPRRQRTGRYHLSLAYERAGKPEAARQVLAEVRKMQEAETLRLALPTRPNDPDLRVRAAKALLDSGSHAEALDLLGQVLERDPAFRPAHALLARYYESQGEKARARNHRKLAGE